MNKTTENKAARVQPDRRALLAELNYFTGDLERYRHWTRSLIYTPGIQHLAERAGAYWLIDLISSWQMTPAVAHEDFQIWKLVVRTDRAATATATGDGQKALASQDIPFTDFPLEEITVWLIDGTLMLPSEY
jgi:hypothetical protein